MATGAAQRCVDRCGSRHRGMERPRRLEPGRRARGPRGLVRRFVAACACALLGLTAAAEGSYAPVVPGRPLQFPQDTGSHPAFRTEWWYVTGWLNTGDGQPLGFQITFFRTKPDIDGANPSAFT